jgi:hypothetical protein
VRIAKLAARNIKGWETFSVELGDVNVAAGANGSNKTSFLSLITALFGRGNPRMLRAGAEEGEIFALVEGEDGESWEFTRRFEKGKVSPTKIKGSKAGPLGAPATFLKNIADAVSIDPISEAMNASEERQTQILLETVKLTLEEAKLMAALADASHAEGLSAVVAKAKKLPALDALKIVEDHIYAKRTDLNRDAKTKAIHAAELRGAPGMDDETDWKEQEKRLIGETNALSEAEHQEELAVCNVKDSSLADLKKEFDAHEKKIDSEIDAQIKALNEQRMTLIKENGERLRENQQRINDLYQEAVKEIAERYRPVIASHMEDCTEAREKANQQVAAKRTREIADQAEQAALEYRDKSDKLTKALESIEELRGELINQVGRELPGLRFDEDKVAWLGKVPLSEVNTQERAKFWLRVAAKRAGEFGVVCMDGAEAFDSAHFRGLVDAAKQTGLQWFFGRVTDEPFHIEKIEAE